MKLYLNLMKRGKLFFVNGCEIVRPSNFSDAIEGIYYSSCIQKQKAKSLGFIAERWRYETQSQNIICVELFGAIEENKFYYYDCYKFQKLIAKECKRHGLIPHIIVNHGCVSKIKIIK